MRVGIEHRWVHVTATDQLTYYAAHLKRGGEALDAIGIVTDFQGTQVHDGWVCYQAYPCHRALCNVHHLRELTFLEEELKQPWAEQMKTLLLEMKAAVEQAKTAGKQELDALALGRFHRRYELVLALGYQANPAPAPPQKTHGGRTRQHAARNLLDRLSIYQWQVLAFLVDFTVPFSNDYVAYCTPSAWLACFVRRAWSLFVGWRKQRNPTAIGVIHGNTTNAPPLPDRLWADSIGLCGFTGG
jgi:transposase